MLNWSAFTANDINCDNLLDLREIQMLIWLVSNAKPTRSELEREMAIMDRDHSNTIDRIEWVSYLSAPVTVSIYQLGNMDYYDFTMRELFDDIDTDGNGMIEIEELIDYIKISLENDYSILDEKRRRQAYHHLKVLANKCIGELKRLAMEYSNPNIMPNMDPQSLTWTEFARYRQVCKVEKIEIQATLTVLYHE